LREDVKGDKAENGAMGRGIPLKERKIPRMGWEQHPRPCMKDKRGFGVEEGEGGTKGKGRGKLLNPVWGGYKEGVGN